MSEPVAEQTSPGMGVVRQVESTSAFDGVGGVLMPAAQRLVRMTGDQELLRSRLLGHALHPVLTDVPVGAWMSAGVLDLSGGSRMSAASRRLVGLGNLAALPTAVTGLAEYATLGPANQRLASAHAVANVAALALNTWSWFARGAGRHGTGRALSYAALATAGAGAFLGGHLSIGKKVGSSQEPLEDQQDSLRQE